MFFAASCLPVPAGCLFLAPCWDAALGLQPPVCGRQLKLLLDGKVYGRRMAPHHRLELISSSCAISSVYRFNPLPS